MNEWMDWARLARRVALQVLASLFLVTVAWVLVYRWVSPPATWLMLERRSHRPEANYGGLLPENASRRINYRFRGLDEVSPQLPLALVAAEDQRFQQHHGFDLDAIQKAAKSNIAGGKQLRGGSTISQQVAKNVFLWQGRSYVRKAAEAYFTVLIELLWSKQRILEVYLNVAEMGDCIFGAEAAAQRYFGKPAKSLSPAEAALLAAVLPNPLKFQAGRPGPAARAKQRRVLRNMRRLGGTTFVRSLLQD
ncbi:monofunctional biosynthetic peptidoglycan transglycosylase [Hymenobacter busanensis]|uniref:Biosynthetic peptidoglycan transglycosylase n=1 Tax=Hymenobacter busanensis TaxID=2607656 RepID=A0A7L4ZU43_9BACT|nr:monofunctional biosynthetic peptidoglycan transglycosylase [Hymenobacter busanensis]KAA9339793.1 monofunctional biosynthetic peptidoglycan transglycosylase [Hymenobacter busanensis]QHJ06453.1 monofunctional biosynthetic peptidoglycan transglycosylase [Hymenobacter busanensis]